MLAGIAIGFVYAAILFWVGFAVAVYLLHLRSPLAIAGTTLCFGNAAFLVLANGLGYILPLRMAVIVTLILLAILAAGLQFFSRTPQHSIDRLDRRYVFGYGFILVLCGLVNARFVGSDPWSWQHFPLAATIAAGNFPVMTPINPAQHLAYHYAPAFLAGTFRLLTGLPLSIEFLFQPFIGGAGVLLFTGALVRRLTKSDRTALVAAVLALMGTGWVWMGGLFAFLQTGVSGLSHPFAFLGTMVGSGITTSLLNFLGHRSTALGFPLVYALLYFFSLIGGKKSVRQQGSLIIVCFVLALALTLTMEIAFVTVPFALGLYIALLWCGSSEDRMTGHRLFVASLLVFLPASLIALVHGGVLSGVLSDHSDSAFLLRPSLSVTYTSLGEHVSFFSWHFLRDFGLPLLLLPFAWVYFWKRHSRSSFFLCLCALASVHLIIPFLVQYTLIPGEMHRLFYTTSTIGSLLAGVLLMQTFVVSKHRFVRISGWILIASMLVSSSIYFCLRLTIPTMRLETAPIFAGLPPVTASQQRLYNWVSTHTTLSDWFYVRNLTVDFHDVSQEEAQMRDRVLFTTYTGRYTIGPIIFWSYDSQWLDTVLVAEKTCSADAMKTLGVRYLLVETADRAVWFDAHCDSAKWISRYDDPSIAPNYPRVYELR
ncbi:MAG: hypothetical protein KBD00_03075 [Candidatus Peribacteraceae bacterium]|nr:hypothetical protein [Candidatus Peribacteraceae bacterium]